LRFNLKKKKKERQDFFPEQDRGRQSDIFTVMAIESVLKVESAAAPYPRHNTTLDSDDYYY